MLVIFNPSIVLIKSWIRCLHIDVIRRIGVVVSLSKSGSLRAGKSFLKDWPKWLTRCNLFTTTKQMSFIAMEVSSTLEQQQGKHWGGVEIITFYDGDSAVNSGSRKLSNSCGDNSSKWKPVIELSLDVLSMRLWYWSEPRIIRGNMHRLMPLVQADVSVDTRFLPPPVGCTKNCQILVFVVCAAKMVEPTSVCHS